MCGICGVVAVDGMLDPAIARAIYPMTASLRHRGPDGDGHFIDRRAALGHRRLAIIDREGGRQPMTSETGTWIVFNGEIYNHRALRRELEGRGRRFRTSSDTEVILHAYAEYGPRCVERLNGMFAFAIYDPANGELFIARDRLGKKPLFFAIFGGALHFASELKALTYSPAWQGTVDPSRLEGYLSLGYILAPATIYKQVKKLEPGHWLHLRNGHIRTARYWDVQAFDDTRLNAGEVLDEVSSLLREAVVDRLESEVPLGAFLSGGIDSGLVVSYMAEAMNSPVHTTSVGFGTPGETELGAAALTAAKWGTNQVSEIVQPRLEEVLDSIAGGFDEPFADASAIPTNYVSKVARRNVTVALTGDGGDESFGGYSFRYVPHIVEGAIRRLLTPGMREAMGWLGERWPRSRRLPRALRVATLLDNISVDAPTAYFADLCITKPRTVQRLLGGWEERPLSENSVFDAVTAPYRRCSSRSDVQRAQYADLKIYLANDVLVKVDRMSMAHGLEVRSPLLDYRLVELAFRIPASMKMPRLQAKHLLRQVARTRLPDAVLKLPKRGFHPPMGQWIAGPHKAMFVDDVLGPGSFSASVLDVGVVRQLLDAHCRGEADHSMPLWAIWMMERWSRTTRLSTRHEPAAAITTKRPRTMEVIA
jgi:asparagine synthase (glutamine-hydrolysing)